MEYGLLAAVGAMVAWTLGDFSIQRAVRVVGNIPALFAIGALGLIVLTPIVWSDIPDVLTPANFWLLGATLVVTIVAAVLDFEALRVGKLAVIEPVMSFELPLTVLISLTLLQEIVRPVQLVLIGGIFLGILLTVSRPLTEHWWQRFQRTRRLERGVLLGLAGAVAMATANVLTGRSSQETNPLLAIWFIHSGIALGGGTYLVLRGRTAETIALFRRHPGIVLAESVFDNLAWIAYAVAATALPIAVAIGLTESYVAFAALLGLLINRERLRRRQIVGIALALSAAISLAIITG